MQNTGNGAICFVSFYFVFPVHFLLRTSLTKCPFKCDKSLIRNVLICKFLLQIEYRDMWKVNVVAWEFAND